MISPEELTKQIFEARELYKSLKGITSKAKESSEAFQRIAFLLRLQVKNMQIRNNLPQAELFPPLEPGQTQGKLFQW